MKSVMLDFETFGTNSNACIVQVGACYFDPKTGEIGDVFQRNVDARSSVNSGGVIDADTVYWWLGQSKEAIDSITALHPKKDIYEVFAELNNFLSDAKEIWSHATFDFVILQETMKRLLITPRYRYTAARDIRTLNALTGHMAQPPRTGIHHDALADCLHQVKYVTAALNRIELK